MTRQLVVRTSGGADDTIINEVVASLPVSFALAGGPDIDVITVDGSTAWPDALEAAVLESPRFVVVVNPGEADPADIRRVAIVAAAREVPVLLSEGWAGNPAIALVRSTRHDAVAAATLLESFALEPLDGVATQGLILRQLRALRRMGVEIARFTTSTSSNRGYTANGVTAAGTIVSLFGARTAGASDELSLGALSASSALEVIVPPDRTARPARIHATTADDMTTVLAAWETAHRATFRLILDFPGSTTELDDFATDVVLARSALE